MDAALPTPDATCDGGSLDCGSGLLLIIRSAMSPLASGRILEVRSTESSVREDLPAWCRMVGHRLEHEHHAEGAASSYFIRKRSEDAALAGDLSKARDFKWRVRVVRDSALQSIAYVRNHRIPIGQPASFETADPAPSAVEVLLGSLGAALSTAFEWRLQSRSFEVERLEVALEAASRNILVFLGLEEEGSSALDGVSGRLYVDTDAPDDLIEEVWRETLARCPITRSLTENVAVRIEVRRG